MVDDARRPGREEDDPNLDEVLQREIDEALEGTSLEQLLEAEPPEDSDADFSARTGQRAAGAVVGIDDENVFVELGGKMQGILPVEQFTEGALPQPGERVEFLITGRDRRDDLLLLTLPGAAVEADWDSLSEGQVLEGRVTGHNKGGLELDVNGIRAFMPISQIELYRVEDISGYVTQRLRCSVIEVDRSNRKLVVSRRALLEVEAEQRREQVMGSLKEGQVVSGVVKSLMPYGAFVDIGGVDGLLHISDMSHGRVDDATSVVSQGQQLDVRVLSIDPDSGRISLGLKQLMPDPWERVPERYHKDEIVGGRVTRLMDFGAFVELEPGLEGLIPVSELSFKRVRHPREVLGEGEAVTVRIMQVDLERRRISLSLKQAGEDPWTGASVRWPVGSLTEGIVTKIADFGAFVELAPGVEGLVHISELSSGRVRSVSDAVEEGRTVRVRVLRVDEDARRISLSMSRAAAPAAGEAASTEEAPSKPQRKRPLKGGLD